MNLAPLAAKLRAERSFLCGTPALLSARVGRGNGFFVRARDRALCGCSQSENLCGFDLGLPVHVVQELAACAFYIRAWSDGGSFKGFALSCLLSGILPDQCQTAVPLGTARAAR